LIAIREAPDKPTEHLVRRAVGAKGDEHLACNRPIWFFEGEQIIEATLLSKAVRGIGFYDA
jgi:hypothetical protein